jgi:GTP pyrophosphokinase
MSLPQAKDLAKKLYKDKVRLSGESYYKHAMEIVERLRRYGIKEENTLAAAALHHAFDENKEKVRKELEKKVPETIIDLIDKYYTTTEANIKTEAFEKYNEKYLLQAFVNLAKDIRVLIIRTADKLDALEKSWALNREEQKRAAQRALLIYAPLAKFIGISKISRDIEDTAFKISYPQDFFNLEQIVKKKSWGSKKIFRETEKFLTEILEEQGMDNFQIQYRTKGLYSLYRKIARYKKQRKEIGNNCEKIYDIFALRIIVNTVEECYLVENLITQLLNHIPEERNDYIKEPRPTGYQSIHNAIELDKDFFAEVQIRTHEMHKQAEFGISSHLLYKMGDKGEKSKATKEFRKYLKGNPELFRDLNYWEVEKDQNYTPDTPFKNKIYVFTPKGDIIELPEEATVVDFGYAVHTEIGNKCGGAFVNNKIVKLDTKLKTGDIVKIKVDKRKKKPSKHWLDFVKTRRAKIQINKAWKN